MKSTMEILTKLQENSQKNHDEIFTRLYRYLLRPDIYFIAYQHLYSNKGAGTKGVNDDTADGFSEQYGVMSNVRFDELELMLVAMFEQPTLKDTIQVLTEVQLLVAEDAEMAALVQQTIPKMQQLNEQQFKGLELEWHRPEEPEKEKM